MELATAFSRRTSTECRSYDKTGTSKNDVTRLIALLPVRRLRFPFDSIYIVNLFTKCPARMATVRASRRTPIICELPLKILSVWYAMCQSVTAINMPLEPVPVNLTQQRSVSCSYSHENRAKQFKLETTSRSRFFGSRATPFELVLKRRVKCELCAVNSPRNLKK